MTQEISLLPSFESSASTSHWPNSAGSQMVRKKAADRVNKNQPLRADCWFIGTQNQKLTRGNTRFQFNRTLPVFTGGTTSPLGRMPWAEPLAQGCSINMKSQDLTWVFKSKRRANPHSTPRFPGMSTWLWWDGTMYLPWAYCMRNWSCRKVSYLKN